MTRPKHTKKDANQLEIVHELEALGAVVWDCANIGGTVLDLIVFWRGLAIAVEIKVPDNRDGLTDNERKGIRLLKQVGVEAVVATCTEDIVEAFQGSTIVDLRHGARPPTVLSVKQAQAYRQEYKRLRTKVEEEARE